MLIRACVVFERGTARNCWGSSFSMTAGLTYSVTTKSSANFDKIGVRDIGRRCFDTSWINFSLGIGIGIGIGIISASFQVVGRRTCRKEQFIMSAIDSASTSAFSFSSHPGIPSGPCAFDNF
jgi:hypothetical protein